MLVFRISIVLLLFVGNNVLYYFGVVPTSLVTTLLPSFYLCILSLVFHKFRTFDVRHSKRNELLLFGIVTVLFAMQFYMKAKGFVGDIANMLLLPIMISFLYPSKDEFFKTRIRYLLVLFYCVDSFWSIGERVIGKNIFPFTGVADANVIIYSLEGFRSTALQDHPLNNALCLTAIMLFVLSSKQFMLKTKMVLFTLGFMAILCFNTRSSMILWSLTLLVFITNIVFSRKKGISNVTKIKFVFMITIIFALVIYVVNRFDLGDRLMSQKLMDDSALVRVRSIDLFLNSNFTSILFGLPSDKIEYLMYKSDILIIENFWIIYFLRYGLIGFSLLIIGYSLLLKRILGTYSRYAKIFCIGFFFLLASTNNSFAVYAQPMCIFILSCYSFADSSSVQYKRQTKRLNYTAA